MQVSAINRIYIAEIQHRCDMLNNAENDITEV